MDVAIEASAASRLHQEHDDDLCDRLLRKYTFVILVGFAVLTTFEGYWGVQIACAVTYNVANNGNYVEVIKNLCYMNNTYIVPDQDTVEDENYIRKNMISYYQWTPIICVISIMLVLFPSFVWRSCAPSYRKITEIPRNYSFILSLKEQDNLFKKATLIVGNVIAHTNQPRRLAYTYISIKILTLVVLAVNIVIFALPVETINIFKLWSVSQNYISTSSKFPILTHCSVNIHSQSADGSNQKKAWCVLPNNILHFYFFLFCLHWFIFLFIITVLDLIYWCVLICDTNSQLKYVLSHLHCAIDPKDMHGFVRMLGPDGVFMLAMTSKNGSDLFASILTESLLKMYMQNKMDIQQS